ncbi:MAG TPA: ATP-binding protein [Kofleriaceae bacterium]|nr:ATP-binding protein [Kofleriaceae bacterium]
MKVGPRITAVTSALVASTLAVYAFFDLRDRANDRSERTEIETRAQAAALRTSVELQGVAQALAQADELSQELSQSLEDTQVVVLPAAAIRWGVGDESIDRLRVLVQARPLYLSTEDDERLVYTLPLRTPSRTAPDGYEVAGSIELSRSLAPLAEAWRDDLLRTLPLLTVIVALVVIAVMLFTRSLVTGPIEKLLAGIDDVARGDLSRVLLSEREDEIGALATRFNEMTYSLRESRAETERQNAHKMKLEERLFQTEKLATIGQLAAEIAHEVGTPLNVIVGRSRAMAKKAGDPEAVSKNADIVAEQASRITRIIQRLLDTARRKVGAPELGPVDLNQIALTTMDFLEGKFAAARVVRTLSRAEGLPPVKGDSDQLQQVLLNLLLNAIEAMPKGGQVRVETSLVTRRRPGLEVAPEQPVVVVEVADTGVGVPAEQRERVFEPFYTTKEGRGGTGLGLSVTHGIIKEHDGWIEVDEAPGGVGSVFRVCLPAAVETG